MIIVVVYNRKLEACESFRSIRNIAKKEPELNLFVYDNSPVAQEIRNHEGLKISYFHDPKNSGVSKAYNKGVAFAQESRKEWVLLLDQDTSLPSTIIADYASAIEKHQTINLFVPILKLGSGEVFSPFRYRFKRGFYLQHIEAGVHSLEKIAPVNSGMTVRVETFLQVGGYNDKVKLDFSDFQFIERFKGFNPEFYVMDVVCIQDFSDNETSLQSQKRRFEFFVDGARNIEKRNFLDLIQYHNIVLARALKLTVRFRNMTFLKHYLGRFLFSSGH